MPIAVALFIALLQGVTELFPVSSLGHAVILPAIFHLPVDQSSEAFLPFLVMLHLGTAVALLLFFWRDWLALLLGLLVGSRGERPGAFKMLSLIVIATIPAVVLGLALEKTLAGLFSKPWMAAGFLFLNGFLLFAGDRLKKRDATNNGGDLSKITWKVALAVGFWQCLAFLPGLSRSGATLVGGLAAGLSYRASAYFSFLIATPVILGAGVLEVPKMIKAEKAGELASGMLGTSIIAGVVAGVAAWISVWFLMRYFRKTEVQAMLPFAAYCWLAGGVALLVLGLR